MDGSTIGPQAPPAASGTSAFYAGLAEILEVPAIRIGADLDLRAHNWDSLAVISCVVLIDECFGVLASGSALTGCRTVGDLDRLVAADIR